MPVMKKIEDPSILNKQNLEEIINKQFSTLKEADPKIE